MSNFDSEWLVKKIEQIVDAPVNPRTVIASGVDQAASRAYAKEVRDHLSRNNDEARRSDHLRTVSM